MRHGGLRERRQISPLLRTLAPAPKSENRPARLPEEDREPERGTPLIPKGHLIGLGFLMGYAEGSLPGGFASPAGLGDIFMAMTAPWIAARVVADDWVRLSKRKSRRLNLPIPR